jgi:hypothetical protein
MNSPITERGAFLIESMFSADLGVSGEETKRRRLREKERGSGTKLKSGVFPTDLGMMRRRNRCGEFSPRHRP